MDREKYVNDLKEIRDIMNRSSRFISLSGLSGISAGIIALIGAYLVYNSVYAQLDLSGFGEVTLTGKSLSHVMIIASATLFLALGTGIYFTRQETKKQNLKIWDYQTRRLLINLAIPLFTGGIVCLIFLLKGYLGLIAPLTLIFYGLALVNASKYTLSEIRSLGLLEISLGLVALLFPGYGLLFWSVGFGILHIVYGIAIPLRYPS